jgi:hypothetical protein
MRQTQLCREVRSFQIRNSCSRVGYLRDAQYLAESRRMPRGKSLDYASCTDLLLTSGYLASRSGGSALYEADGLVNVSDFTSGRSSRIYYRWRKL